MTKIVGTMTIREAAEVWDDPQKVHLTKWERDFGPPLNELHIGHVRTYQAERIEEVDASVVNLEVDALRALLRHAGVGEEIERFYRPLKEDVTLTREELNVLSPRVIAYIRNLEESLRDLQREHHQQEDELRRKRWAYWNSKRY